MNTLLVPVYFAVIASVSGGVMIKSQHQTDSEVASSHPGLTTVKYIGHGHHAHLGHVHKSTMWKAHESTKNKAWADHHANFAALKAKAVAEEESKALAFQVAVEAKALADKEAKEGLWKAQETLYKEIEARIAAQQAEFAAKQASLISLDAHNAAEELNKTYLAAKARAEEEANNSTKKNRIADDVREKAVLATQAKLTAEGVATIAAQKAKNAEETFWKAKPSAWTW